MGAKTEEVPAAREERQVQEAVDKGEVGGETRGIQEQSMSGSFKKKKEKKRKSEAEAVRGPQTDETVVVAALLCRSMKRILGRFIFLVNFC